MKTILTTLLCALFFLGHAQKIENLNATFADGKVTINYNLAEGNAKQKYNVSLFSSHNNFASPLTMVTGDVGNNLAGGPLREIVWNAEKELGNHKGEVSFKIKAEVLLLPFEFITPSTSKALRRGKNTSLQWSGGVPNEIVKLEVYKGGERIAAIADTKNTGTYSWSVPKDYAKAMNYTLRITDSRQAVTSSAFAVKAKVPLLLKLSPLLIGAAIIPFLGGSGGGKETTPASEQLAAAPNPN